MKYLSQDISRRKFVSSLTGRAHRHRGAFGIGFKWLRQPGAGAGSRPDARCAACARHRGAAPPAAAVAAPAVHSRGVKSFQGRRRLLRRATHRLGREIRFGNSASEDAQFYEALVDRLQLKYILTPHEGPGAAMAAGYIRPRARPRS